jgi:RNA polymerase sigma factor (sigma-70 family)
VSTTGRRAVGDFFLIIFQQSASPDVMPSDPPLMPMSELPTELPQAGLLAALARFERPLVRYALGLCGDLEQARDAVQDTFVKLSRDPARAAIPATSEQVEALAPWLFTVCKNRVIDLHRKSSRLVPMDTALLESAPAATPAPDAALARKDTARQLRRLIADLPEKQRHLLQLKFESGLSYKEMAAATGLTTSNIGWIIHQAVQSLRTSWEAAQDA